MRELIQIKSQSIHIFILVFCLIDCFANQSFAHNNFEETLDNKLFDIPVILQQDDTLYASSTIDSTQLFKSLAIDYSQVGDAESSAEYILKYIRNTSDLSILNDHLFEDIKNKEAYLLLKERFDTRVSFLSTIYFYAGFLGFFIFLV